MTIEEIAIHIYAATIKDHIKHGVGIDYAGAEMCARHAYTLAVIFDDVSIKRRRGT